MKGNDSFFNWECYANRKNEMIQESMNRMNRMNHMKHRNIFYYSSSEEEEEFPEKEHIVKRNELSDFLNTLVELMNSKFTLQEKLLLNRLFARLKRQDEMGNIHEIKLCHSVFKYEYIPASNHSIASGNVGRDYFHQSPMVYGSSRVQW